MHVLRNFRVFFRPCSNYFAYWLLQQFVLPWAVICSWGLITIVTESASMPHLLTCWQGKVCQLETDVLPLCYATNHGATGGVSKFAYSNYFAYWLLQQFVLPWAVICSWGLITIVTESASMPHLLTCWQKDMASFCGHFPRVPAWIGIIGLGFFWLDAFPVIQLSVSEHWKQVLS